MILSLIITDEDGNLARTENQIMMKLHYTDTFPQEKMNAEPSLLLWKNVCR